MELGIEAVRWAVGRALGPVSDAVLETWALSSGLGTNVRALRMELQCAQWMLNSTRGNSHNHGQKFESSALPDLLQELLDLAYRADDTLDLLDYFRIQDELGTNDHEDDDHGGDCLHNLVLGPCHTIRAVGKHLPRYSVSPQQNDVNSNIASSGHRFLCFAYPSKAPQREHIQQTPKLKFHRAHMSQKMNEIVEQLKHVCAKVSTILNNLELMDSNCTVAQCIATRLDTSDSKNRWHTSMLVEPKCDLGIVDPKCDEGMLAPKLYGRMDEKSKIIDEITEGKYYDTDLTVLPIVGPGGLGKTTLAQNIYQELQAHFVVRLWVCVSFNFNVYRLTKDIAYKLSNDITDSPDKLIEERLESKRFLLVLDDLWSYAEDEWKRFLKPFMNRKAKGSVVLVTTRFPAVAQMVTTTDLIYLKDLADESIKELFWSSIFGDEQEQSQNDYRELLDIGDRILEKVKGSPLAAKTVGRLLRNNFAPDYWIRVLNHREWEIKTHADDIMPALKLSFVNLPFHLQQCFKYCAALFPPDYKFSREEIIHFWIGLDILHPYGENARIEDVGLSHLSALVDYGFFRKEEDEDRHTCYVIHDLLQELALHDSRHECLSIYISNMRSIKIPPSIRHLSINIDDSSVGNKMTFENCKKDFSALVKGLKAENLHSLMLFGKHQDSFAKAFGDLFDKARALRVVFISGETYSMEDYLLPNIWKLVHLRYLRIRGVLLRSRLFDISRLYYLRVLDLQGCSDMFYHLPTDMSKLIKLRHFLVPDDEMYLSIFEVGRLTALQELRRFEAKRLCRGFELRQIGHLLELGGSLRIENLEKVEVREANEANLMLKTRLHSLRLDWDICRLHEDPAREEQVLEGLKPCSNLLELCISGHRGTTCPSWLGVNLSVKNLESLRLDSVTWTRYPPIGELWLVNEHGEELSSDTSNQFFQNLRRIELVKLAGLKKWVVGHHLFIHLEVLIIEDCPELEELPFPYSPCMEQEQQNCFPRLQELKIDNCPKLLSLPPVPWTFDPCLFRITKVGLCFEQLVYKNHKEHASSLEIEGKDVLDGSFWMAVDFLKLIELKKLKMVRCPPVPLDLFQKFIYLKTVEISDSNNAFWPAKDGRAIRYQFPVESVHICGLGASGKELTQVLSYMPKLAELVISDCERLTGLGVVEQLQEATTSSNEVETQIGWLQNSVEEEEIATEGLLLLPPQLHKLLISGCPSLSLLPDSLIDDKEARLTQQAGWLRGLCSLRSLKIWDCPRFLSYLPSSSSCLTFPTSLQKLSLGHVEGMETLAPLLNLPTLTEMEIIDCGDLRGEGLWHLLTQGCLTKLSVSKTPNFFIGSQPSGLHEEGRSSSRLQILWTDDVAGVLAVPICMLLSSLISLFLFENEMEFFTKEQEEALMLLTTLLEFRLDHCDRLQFLPAGLHRIPCLKRLEIKNSQAIRSLPKDGLPSSLEKLKIMNCPAIQKLPKVDLPSSLRVLNVACGNSEELRRQCRKLIGIIPIVKA